MKKMMSDYELEKLLYKAAGLDEFVHWLMNEIDLAETEKYDKDISVCKYIETTSELTTLKRVKDVYTYFKKYGKLPEMEILKLKWKE